MTASIAGSFLDRRVGTRRATCHGRLDHRLEEAGLAAEGAIDRLDRDAAHRRRWPASRRPSSRAGETSHRLTPGCRVELGSLFGAPDRPIWPPALDRRHSFHENGTCINTGVPTRSYSGRDPMTDDIKAAARRTFEEDLARASTSTGSPRSLTRTSSTTARGPTSRPASKASSGPCSGSAASSPTSGWWRKFVVRCWATSAWVS